MLYIRLRMALAASQSVLAAGVTALSAAYPTCRAFQSSLSVEGRAVFVIRSVRHGTIIWHTSHDMWCCSYLHAASLSGPRRVAACRQARNAAGSGAGTGVARRPAHVRHADYGAAFRHLRRARGRPRRHPQAHAGCVPSQLLIHSSKTSIFRHLRTRRLVVTPKLVLCAFPLQLEHQLRKQIRKSPRRACRAQGRPRRHPQGAGCMWRNVCCTSLFVCAAPDGGLVGAPKLMLRRLNDQ